MIQNRAGDRDIGLPVAIDVAVDGDVAPAQVGHASRDGGTRQSRSELDVPSARIVIRSRDGFNEGDSVWTGIGHQRLHRGGVAIHHARSVGDGDQSSAIEDHGRNGDCRGRVALRAYCTARGR